VCGILRAGMTVAALIVLTGGALSEGNAEEASSTPASPMADLSPLLEPIREVHGLAALAGSIVVDGRTIGIGATGERARGRNDPVEPEDSWHLGSNSKAMTATLLALLVEEGKLSWGTTLGEVFPEETAAQPAWRTVTLEQLLQHRSGLPEDLAAPPGSPWHDVSPEGPLPSQRRGVARAFLAHGPEVPGNTMRYSNAGYVIAASMAEVRTGEAWEDLLRTRLFEPLGMSSAGFGPPRPLPEPQGHLDGEPLGTGARADNPPVLGPAATVHASLEDWGKFIALHLSPPKGARELLPATSFARMHAPPAGGNYAMGWFVLENESEGRILTHAGSNGYWYAVVWAMPERGYAVLVATNEGGSKGAAGTDAAAQTLIQHYQAERAR